MRRFVPVPIIKETLRKMRIVVDTREQVNKHITDYYSNEGVEIINRALQVGDYSAQIDEDTLEHEVVIERKNSLDELCQCVGRDRDRFEREFLRAKANGTKVFLLVEDATWNDIFVGNYRSQVSPKSLVATLCYWQIRYGITVIFCKKTESAPIIYGLLYYAAYNDLKGENHVH